MTDYELIAMYYDWCELYQGSSFDPSTSSVELFIRWQDASRHSIDPENLRPEEKRFLKAYKKQRIEAALEAAAAFHVEQMRE